MNLTIIMVMKNEKVSMKAYVNQTHSRENVRIGHEPSLCDSNMCYIRTSE